MMMGGTAVKIKLYAIRCSWSIMTEEENPLYSWYQNNRNTKVWKNVFFFFNVELFADSIIIIVLQNFSILFLNILNRCYCFIIYVSLFSHATFHFQNTRTNAHTIID